MHGWSNLGKQHYTQECDPIQKPKEGVAFEEPLYTQLGIQSRYKITCQCFSNMTKLPNV